MLHIEDKSFRLPDGRTLAYADNGNTSSSSVVLFLHGAFNVGDASHLAHILVEKNVHFVAPTLPGWGKSSAIPDPYNYAATFAADITSLITHLHPNTSTLKLYICGHSFGTVQSQMLYGLPQTSFPLREHVVAVVLLAPASPPQLHKDYAKTLIWPYWFMIGPPAYYFPFNHFPKLVKYGLGKQIYDEPSAERFIRKTMSEAMDEEELQALARFKASHGLAEEQFEQERGKIMWLSVARSWQGFLDNPVMYLHGWGESKPQDVDDGCPILVVSSDRDFNASAEHAKWIAKNYKSATLKIIHGAHISSFFHLEEIWTDVFEKAPPS